jgi:hypothetical protein
MLHKGEPMMEANENNNADNRKVSEETGKQDRKKNWEPMKLTYVGEAKDIVQSGGGKVGVTQQDPGDTQKPQGLA